MPKNVKTPVMHAASMSSEKTNFNWKKMRRKTKQSLAKAGQNAFNVGQKAIITTAYLNNLSPVIIRTLEFLAPYQSVIHSCTMFASPGFALLFGTVSQWFKTFSAKKRNRMRHEGLFLLSLIFTAFVITNPFGAAPAGAVAYGLMMISVGFIRSIALFQRFLKSLTLSNELAKPRDQQDRDKINKLKNTTHFDEAGLESKMDDFNLYCLHKSAQRGLKAALTLFLMGASGISLFNPLLGVPLVLCGVLALGVNELGYKSWFHRKYQHTPNQTQTDLTNSSDDQTESKMCKTSSQTEHDLENTDDPSVHGVDKISALGQEDSNLIQVSPTTYLPIVVSTKVATEKCPAMTEKEFSSFDKSRLNPCHVEEI